MFTNVFVLLNAPKSLLDMWNEPESVTKGKKNWIFSSEPGETFVFVFEGVVKFFTLKDRISNNLFRIFFLILFSFS